MIKNTPLNVERNLLTFNLWMHRKQRNALQKSCPPVRPPGVVAPRRRGPSAPPATSSPCLTRTRFRSSRLVAAVFLCCLQIRLSCVFGSGFFCVFVFLALWTPIHFFLSRIRCFYVFLCFFVYVNQSWVNSLIM